MRNGSLDRNRRFQAGMKAALALAACALTLAGCATRPASGETAAKPGAAGADAKDTKPKEPAPLARPYTTPADPYPSTYKPPQSPPTLIRGATVLTGTGTKLENA